MGRSQETFNKKDVRDKQLKKRKEKEAKKIARKESGKASFEDMIAYVDENGVISSTPADPSKKTVIKAEDIAIGVPTRASLPKEDPIRKGVVSFFNDSKGFGFIRDMETKESVFVHINNLLDAIKEGNLVSYEVEKGPKGPSAVRVKVVK